MRHLLATALLIVLGLPAKAETNRGAEVLALTAGVICAPEPTGFRDAPDTITGRTHVLDHMPEFVADTQTVPAVLGVGFGVRVQATAETPTQPMTITMVHPPMGDSGVTQQSFTSTITGEGPTVAFFQFDHPYELVTGEWMFEGRTSNGLVYRVPFRVVPPQAMPALAGACSYSDLLS